MKERERERVKTIHLIYVTFVPFFPSRIFQIQTSLLTKRSTKTDSERECCREKVL